MAAFFTEFVRIDADDVNSLLDLELERNENSSLWLDHLGDLELANLWEALPGTESDGTIMEDLLSPHDGELLVFSTPGEFLSAIRGLTDNGIPDVAKKWSKTDELSHWKIDDLSRVIRELREFVNKAYAKNQIVVQLAEI